MPETTMQGVSLHTKARGRPTDVFELALTYEGIEIRRPGEPTRHLSWDRITEWEIEQRRGGVLLTLRGGGSVTPLVIPRWKVDDLDLVLRDVTSYVPDIDTSTVDTSAVDTVPAPAVAHVSAPDPPAPAPAIGLDLERVLEIELGLEPEPEPIPDDVIPPALRATPTAPEPAAPVQAAPEVSTTPPPAPTTAAPVRAVESPLAWPERSPLGTVPDLQWPQGGGQEAPAGPIDARFMEARGDPSILSASATLPPIDEFALPAPAKTVSWAPDEAAPSIDRPDEPFVAVTPPRARQQARTGRRRQVRVKIPVHALATVALLGALAFAVAMVLAQSAGAIHLGFLGPIA